MIIGKNKLIHLITIILLFVIAGTVNLVIHEFNARNICPKILSIPACYIVLGLFIFGLFTHLFQNKLSSLIFYISIGIITLMAITGTYGEISGNGRCPKFASGIPMCYFSLGICLSLLMLKTIIIKVSHNGDVDS